MRLESHKQSSKPGPTTFWDKLISRCLRLSSSVQWRDASQIPLWEKYVAFHMKCLLQSFQLLLAIILLEGQKTKPLKWREITSQNKQVQTGVQFRSFSFRKLLVLFPK